LAITPFDPTGLGASIASERYIHSETNETWDDACWRVAEAVSKAETNGKREKFKERFYWQLRAGLLMPGGRIMSGAGRAKQQMLNCFVVPAHDSIEGWANTSGHTMIISAKSGGVGTNYSAIRPRGYPIGGMGGVATGAISLMQVIDSVGKVIKDGAGRRTALMMCLDVNHPDIEEFLSVKLDDKQLNNANISIVIPPDLPTEEFQQLVREDGDIPLMFGGLPDKLGERTVKAREIWNKAVENAWINGEPGVLNSYEANKMSNLSYHWPLISTNPCGEIWLPAYGCCDLGALVLPRFVVNGNTLDWDMLDESIRLAVRFLDNVLDVNDYPLTQIEQVCQEERRIGLGVMGLHSMLLDLGMKYDSDEALEFVDQLFSFIKNTAYDASITLAAEKGAFPAYKPDFLKGGFAKTLKRGIRNKIKEHGIRNCALMTIAPTGTTSMVQGVTAGIEPVFSPVYIRRRRVVDETSKKQEEKITETLVISQEYVDHPKLVQGAHDIAPRYHMEMQKVVQKHIDNAVSKTINLPKEFPVGELADLWLEYLPYMKGSTFYREGSRETADSFEPMRHIPLADMQSTVDSWTGELEYEIPDSMDCASGVCDIPVKFADAVVKTVEKAAKAAVPVK
jgi:ribonucleoside-diphosphate reductase alpha chain